MRVSAGITGLELQNAAKVYEEEKKYVRAFGCQREAVKIMCRERYDELEIVSFVQTIANQANEQAMELLRDNKRKNALRLLNETAELLLEFERRDLAGSQTLTYNNVACIYKNAKDFQSSLKALTRALDICLQYSHKENLAVTYLNISTVMGKLNNHKAAFDNAIKAAFQCQEDLGELRLNGESGKVSNKVVHLAMAFHHMGVHEENLGNKNSAIEWYRKACATMESDGGTDPEIRIKFYNKLRDITSRKPLPLAKTTSFATASPLTSKRRPKFLYSASAVGKASKHGKFVSKGLSKHGKSPGKRGSVKEMAKPPMFVQPTDSQRVNVDRTTKDMLMTELKYNLREDYGKPNHQVSPKINSYMVIDKHYPKHRRGREDVLSAESEDEVEMLRKLRFGDWADPRHLGNSSEIVIHNKPAKKKLTHEQAAAKIQNAYRGKKFVKLTKNKDQYDAVYKEVYKPNNEEFKNNAVVLVLRGSREEKMADLRLVQLSPCGELFAMRERIDNEAALDASSMREVWAKVKAKSKGVIAKDAQKYFKKLRKHNKDDDLLTYGLHNMLTNEEPAAKGAEIEEEPEVEEKFVVEEEETPKKKTIFKVEEGGDDENEKAVNQHADSYIEDEMPENKEEEKVSNREDDAEKYEDEDLMGAKKEESYVSEDENAAENRAEEFDNEVQKEVERILGGKAADNEPPQEDLKEKKEDSGYTGGYHEISESIQEDEEISI